MPIVYSVPSPSLVSPQLPLSSRPVNSRVLKFTTPAMASEPYVAEAPPVMISTFSMIAAGIRLRSTTPVAFDGVMRRPSMRTSVRVVTRPRSATLAWPPFDGLFDVQRVEHGFHGRCAGLLEQFLVDGRDRAGGLVVLADDAATRDRDFLDVGFVLGGHEWRDPNSRGRAGDQCKTDRSPKRVVFGFHDVLPLIGRITTTKHRARRTESRRDVFPWLDLDRRLLH